MSLPVVLLHGALGSRADLAPLEELFRPFGPVFAPNLLGHGGRPVPSQLSMETWSADVLAQLDASGVSRAVFCGYSLGGYLALYLARHHSERVAGVMTLATKFVYDPHTGRTHALLADPRRLASGSPDLAAHFARVHAPQDWTAVAQLNRGLFRTLTEAPPLAEPDLSAIHCPALVVSGMQDQIVSEQETRQLARQLPRARLLLFAGPAHPLGVVPLAQLEPHIAPWLSEAAAPPVGSTV